MVEMSKQTQNVDHTPKMGFTLPKGYLGIINVLMIHIDIIKDNKNGTTMLF